MGYDLIDAFDFPEDVDDWLECPDCSLKPKVWIFDNGRFTGCGCGSRYDHPGAQAESIMSCWRRGGQYDSDALRKNWNHWVNTREHLWKYGRTNVINTPLSGG